jgi:hypothetical protein
MPFTGQGQEEIELIYQWIRPYIRQPLLRPL